MEKKSTKTSAKQSTKTFKDVEAGITGPVLSEKEDESELTPDEQKEKTYRREFLSRAKRELARDVDSRRRYDYEWMVRDMFRRGYHFSRYQPSTQTIILASRQSAKIPINLVAAQMRSIRNQVTSFRPKWEVLPRYTTKESQTQARYAGRFLDYFFDKNNLKIKIKETVTQGLTFSVGGPWEIYYNKDLKEVRVYLIDPFDFYVDRFAQEGDLSDAQRVVKAVRQPLRDVRLNPEFDKAAVNQIHGSEARLAVSEYKQFIIQSVKQLDAGGIDDSDNVILYEGYFRRRKDDGKAYLIKMVWTDQNTDPLIFEELDDEDDFPFIMYRADINPKEIYGESWMKHVMPVNRVIDNLESSVYDYNHRVAKGRIVVDRDSGVRSISNIHGEIVSKNKGSEVRAMDMPPLPVSVERQVERMVRYQEDISGAHEATLGRIPTGIRSGIGLAELKQSDSTNQDDLVDNLQDFLSLVGTKVLKMVAKTYTNYHFVNAMGVREGEQKNFAVIGSRAGKKGNSDPKRQGQVKIGPDYVDLAIIGEQNNIRVTVGSWLGYTKEMMQDKVLKYAEIGLIDQKTALRLLEFGQVDEIVQQTRIEALLKKNMEPGAKNADGSPQIDQFSLALTENEMMVNEGKPVPADSHDDHLVHIALHQEALGQGADELVNNHIAQHQEFAGQPQSMSAQQDDNIRAASVTEPAAPPAAPGGPEGVNPNGLPVTSPQIAGQVPPAVADVAAGLA